MRFKNSCFVTKEERNEEAQDHQHDPPDREDVEVAPIGSFDLEHTKRRIDAHSDSNQDGQIL